MLSLDDKDTAWAAWPPAYAPNARCVLQARLTPLLNDSPNYAMQHTDVLQNLRSLAWGLGSGEYPKQWWHTPVANFLRGQDLLGVVTAARFVEWVAQGRAANARKACAGCRHGPPGCGNCHSCADTPHKCQKCIPQLYEREGGRGACACDGRLPPGIYISACIQAVLYTELVS